jgi:hypothetical protein
MRKSLQFALAAGSMLIFASAAMTQDATVRLSPLFQAQPQIAQEYAPCSIARGQEREARPLVVGCSTETGSDAGKVFLRASSSASS